MWQTFRPGDKVIEGEKCLYPKSVFSNQLIKNGKDHALSVDVIFDSTLSMSDHISSVSKSCFLSIRGLQRIRNTVEFSTARTIATSRIHSKLDYCKFLFRNLPQSQLDRLQLTLNPQLELSLKLQNLLTSLQFLNLFTGSKLSSASNISCFYNLQVLQSEQPSYLHSLLYVQSNRTTRSSDIITLQRPSIRSRLKLTDRFFTHHAPVLWNSLPKQLRQP